jgi:hypothetical protein
MSTLCQPFPEAEIYAVAGDEWLGLGPDYHGLKNVRLPDAPEPPAEANVILPLRDPGVSNPASGAARFPVSEGGTFFTRREVTLMREITLPDPSWEADGMASEPAETEPEDARYSFSYARL